MLLTPTLITTASTALASIDANTSAATLGGAPAVVWLYVGFITLVLGFLALDLGVFHRHAHVVRMREALTWSAVWIGCALAFNVGVYFIYEHHWLGVGEVVRQLDGSVRGVDGFEAAKLFLTGYVMSASQAAPAVELTRHYASVVVGTDFTPCSAVAVGQALRIAAWSGAPLHVVHVIDTTVVIEIESVLSPMQQGIRDGLTKDANRAWVEFAANIPGAAGLPVDVSINNRIVGILNHARAHKADLLVMGAFGDRRPDVGFGTVATACVRKSMTDVLLVRDTQTGPFKSLVAAVDFSETSARALARAALVAAQDGAKLHVLHVFAAPWHRLSYRAPEPLTPPHLQKQYRDVLERRLADFVLPIADAYKSLRLLTVCYDFGGHRSGIVEYAKSVSADLIALGTRGRTNLRDILLGSTTEKALNDSPCSVLAVKPEGFHHPLAAGEEPRLYGLRPQF